MSIQTQLLASTLGLSLSFGAGCQADPDATTLGDLSLGLTSRVGDVEYRLQRASFTLSGDENLSFDVEGQEAYDLALPAGAYRLALQEGWVLARMEGEQPVPVSAALLSANPAGFEVRSGQSTALTLRFGLAAPDPAQTAAGGVSLGVDVQLQGDASAGDYAPCEPEVVINEVDYDQVGSDDAELVELLNAGPCAVSLADMRLELVNGNNGEAYGSYPLGEVAAQLEPGQLLVLADEPLLATLPETTLGAPLSGSGLQNGPDALRLLSGGLLLDTVAYAGPVTGEGEGEPTAADPGEGSLGRCPDGFDTDDNATDFVVQAATPGLPNDCQAVGW